MNEPGARRAMIDAAERIIAENGIASMTFTGVQSAAKQGNNSAARYHFGSREGLLEAIVEARMAPVNVRRRQMLDDLEELGRPVTLRQAVEALVRPLAAETVGRPGSRYARFLVQALTDPTLGRITPEHLEAESYRRVHQLMVEHSAVPHRVALRRTDSIVILAVASLAVYEGRVRTPAETAEIVSDLVDSCVAVLEAPQASTTARSEGALP